MNTVYWISTHMHFIEFDVSAENVASNFRAEK
jgi:hypothetical protein